MFDIMNTVIRQKAEADRQTDRQTDRQKIYKQHTIYNKVMSNKQSQGLEG